MAGERPRTMNMRPPGSSQWMNFWGMVSTAPVTQTTLNLGRLTDITPEWAMRLRQELQSIRLVQNGPGNTFVSGTAPAPRPPATTTATTNASLDGK